MSPHYKHIYLCHPPFKHLSPVSDMYEAKLEASRSYFLVPPPSAPLRVHQWRSDHSPFSSLSPSPHLLMMLSLASYSPSSSLISYSTSLLSVPLFAGNNYLKQEISKFLIWNLIRSSKSCSSINSPMICYDVLFERGQPLPPGRPSMTPTCLRLKKGEDKVNISRNVCWLKGGACKSNVLCENHHIIIHSYLSKMQFAKIQTVASKKSPFWNSRTHWRINGFSNHPICLFSLVW